MTLSPIVTSKQSSVCAPDTVVKNSWLSLSDIKEKIWTSVRKVGGVIRLLFHTKESHAITSLPREFLEQMISYLPMEDRIKCEQLPITWNSVPILRGIHEALLTSLKKFCVHPQIRQAWKALYGQELPTSGELEKLTSKQLRESSHKYQLYIKAMLDWLRQEKMYTHNLYILDIVPVQNVNPEVLMQSPDQLTQLLEAVQLVNLAQAGGWWELCFGEFRPLSKENLLKAAELSRQSFNTGQSPLLTACACFLTFPPELTTDQSLGGLEIRGSSMFFVPDEINNMKHLKCLKLYNCPNLHSLPETIGDLPNLNKLSIVNVPITSLPLSVAKLSLTELTLPLCMQARRDAQTEGVLRELAAKGCEISYC
jgi:hypothetical protein